MVRLYRLRILRNAIRTRWEKPLDPSTTLRGRRFASDVASESATEEVTVQHGVPEVISNAASLSTERDGSDEAGPSRPTRVFRAPHLYHPSTDELPLGATPYAKILALRNPTERLRSLINIDGHRPIDAAEIAWRDYAKLPPGERRIAFTPDELFQIAELVAPEFDRRPLPEINGKGKEPSARIHDEQLMTEMDRFDTVMDDLRGTLNMAKNKDNSTLMPEGDLDMVLIEQFRRRALRGELVKTEIMSRNLEEGGAGNVARILAPSRHQPEALAPPKTSETLALEAPSDAATADDEPFFITSASDASSPGSEGRQVTHTPLTDSSRPTEVSTAPSSSHAPRESVESPSPQPAESSTSARDIVGAEQPEGEASGSQALKSQGFQPEDILQHRLSSLLRRLKMSDRLGHARPEVQWDIYTRESYAWIFLHIVSGYAAFASLVARLVHQTAGGIALIEGQMFRPNPPPVPSDLLPLNSRCLKLIIECADLVCCNLEAHWVPRSRSEHSDQSEMTALGRDVDPAPPVRRLPRTMASSEKVESSPYVAVLDHIIREILQAGYGVDVERLSVDNTAALIRMDRRSLSALVNYHRRAGKIWRSFAAYDVFTNPSEKTPPDEDDGDDDEHWPIFNTEPPSEDDALIRLGRFYQPKKEVMRPIWAYEKERTFRQYHVSQPTPLQLLRLTPDGQLPTTPRFQHAAVLPMRATILRLMQGAADAHDMQGVALALQICHEAAAQSHNITLMDIFAQHTRIKRLVAKELSCSPARHAELYRHMYHIKPPELRTDLAVFYQINVMSNQMREERHRMDELRVKPPLGLERKARPLAYEGTLLDALRRRMEEWVLLTGREPPLTPGDLSEFERARRLKIRVPDPAEIFEQVTRQMVRLNLDPPFAVVSNAKSAPDVRFWPAQYLADTRRTITSLSTFLLWLNNSKEDRQHEAHRFQTHKAVKERLIFKGAPVDLYDPPSNHSTTVSYMRSRPLEYKSPATRLAAAKRGQVFGAKRQHRRPTSAREGSEPAREARVVWNRQSGTRQGWGSRFGEDVY